MSASIYYQPVKWTHLSVGGGKSSFLDLLRRVMGGEGPWEMDSAHIGRLEGAGAGTDSADYRAQLRATLAQVWPGRQVVICDPDIRLTFATNPRSV